MLDVVFMGTAHFAVPCLDALIRAGHHVCAVVTQPDRPHGRGMKLRPSAVKTLAIESGLPLLQPEKASEPDFVAAIAAIQPQVIVVVAYGQILRPAILEIPTLGCINVHGSLLPELRGAAPIQWSILRGYAETGVTTMFMDRGMDTGDMILKAATPIAPEDTAGTLGERLAPIGADLLVRTLDLLEQGEAPREPQSAGEATYAPMLNRSHGAIDWSRSAVEVRNRIHGCNPAPGAHARRGQENLKIWRAEVVGSSIAATAGTVLDSSELILATGADALKILEIQPENRARLTPSAFVAGYRVVVGEVWGNGLSG